MTRSQWLEQRRTGIGSSDIAALMGIDSFGRTPIDIWLSKVDPKWQKQQSPILSQGLALEGVVAREYAEQTGRKLIAPKNQLFRHPKYPELIATPDRLAKDEKRIVELKVEFFGHNKFGQAGSDQVPDNYLMQVAHQYLVLDYDFADIARLRAGHETEIFPIARDKELEALIIDRAREFWHTYVLPKKEPPIDYGATWAAYLAQKFPKDQGEILTVDEMVNSEALPWVRELADLRSEQAGTERRMDELENKLKALIGENSGLSGSWGTITWKKSKDKVEDVANWEGVAQRLLRMVSPSEGVTREDIMKLVVKDETQKGIVTRKGSRRFILNAKEEQ